MIAEADFLFMESTYGNRNHKDEKDSLNELAEAIAYSHARREKVIIPAFAVERTQEMIYSLHLLAKDGRLPAGHARLRGQPAGDPGDGDLPEVPPTIWTGRPRTSSPTAKIP